MEAIHSRALLVSLSISTWTARKFDRPLTATVNAQHAASPDAGRYNKNLFGGKCDSHAAVLSEANASRKWHYENTLAWETGWQLLPSANYFRYTEEVRGRRSRFESLVSRFVEDYEALRARARVRLNGLYRAEDYPDASRVAEKFDFSVEFSPVPASGDFRIDLPADQVKEIERTVTERVERATEGAVRDAWGRLYEVAAKLRDRLGDPDAIFRDSLIENARQTVDVLSRLNVTNDPELDRLRAAVGAEVEGVSAQELRDDKGLRAAKAARADEILSAMRGC